jgi:hypothetical protein
MKMKENIWYLSNDFNKLPPRDFLKKIIGEDKGNYEKAELELGADIKLLDDAITLYIRAIQAAYSLTDKWRGNDSNRAAIAMLVSTLNYILLARHSILLGYYPEARDLLRSCFERTLSCLLFFHDGKYARRFLSGGKIWPGEIRKELSKLEEDTEKSKELHKGLTEYYDFLSEVVHPNLKSFEARYGNENLGERVGLDYLIGGFMSSERGPWVIIRLLQTVLSALRIIAVILPEKSGKWERECQQIRKKCEEMVDNL